MAASEETCEGNPNFAIICSFITKFGSECGVNITIPYLQCMLEDTKNVNDDLQELLIHLLRRGRKRVNKERWEKCLIKFCHEYSSVDAWELERFGFVKSKLSVKLEILKRLLELQFDANAKFKAEVNKIDANSLRILPLGRDIDGQAYWYQLDKDYNMRLYRESVGEESVWQLLCSTTDGLKELLTTLEKKHPSLKGTCEDELDDPKSPKSPSSDAKPVPKTEIEIQDITRTEDLTSHISETKPCTIIIKTEKKDNSESPNCVRNENCAIMNDINAKLTVTESIDDRGSVKLKLKLEPSLNSKTDLKQSNQIKDNVFEKSAVVADEAVPMDVDTEKASVDTTSVLKEIATSDVEMTEVESIPHDKVQSENSKTEHSDQNISTTNTNSSVTVLNSDSVNHHKGSKIRLYEKWSSEKKKLDAAQHSEESSVIVKNCTVEGKELCVSTSNQQSDPASVIKCPTEQSKNSELIESQPALDDIDMNNDNDTAVDLSKSSRINVIIQNKSSKSLLSNGVSSAVKTNLKKIETNSHASGNSDVIMSEESKSSVMHNESSEKHDECKSSRVQFRNKDISSNADSPVVSRQTGSGFSHLQALQNMCEMNPMGGIQSVIQSTNRESNRVLVNVNKIVKQSDINYENISKSYNFNDMQCSDDKNHNSCYEKTDIVLKSNLYKGKTSEKEKCELGKDRKIIHSTIDNDETSDNLPTDLSCSSKSAVLVEAEENKNKKCVAGENRDKANASTVIKSNCSPAEQSIKVSSKIIEPKSCEKSDLNIKGDLNLTKSHSTVLSTDHDSDTSANKSISNLRAKKSIVEICDGNKKSKRDENSPFERTSVTEPCYLKGNEETVKSVKIKSVESDPSCTLSDSVNIQNEKCLKSSDVSKIDVTESVSLNLSVVKSPKSSSEVGCDLTKSTCPSKSKSSLKDPINSSSTSVLSKSSLNPSQNSVTVENNLSSKLRCVPDDKISPNEPSDVNEKKKEAGSEPMTLSDSSISNEKKIFNDKQSPDLETNVVSNNQKVSDVNDVKLKSDDKNLDFSDKKSNNEDKTKDILVSSRFDDEQHDLSKEKSDNSAAIPSSETKFSEKRNDVNEVTKQSCVDMSEQVVGDSAILEESEKAEPELESKSKTTEEEKNSVQTENVDKPSEINKDSENIVSNDALDYKSKSSVETEKMNSKSCNSKIDSKENIEFSTEKKAKCTEEDCENSELEKPENSEELLKAENLKKSLKSEEPADLQEPIKLDELLKSEKLNKSQELEKSDELQNSETLNKSQELEKPDELQKFEKFNKSQELEKLDELQKSETLSELPELERCDDLQMSEKSTESQKPGKLRNFEKLDKSQEPVEAQKPEKLDISQELVEAQKPEKPDKSQESVDAQKPEKPDKSQESVKAQKPGKSQEPVETQKPEKPGKSQEPVATQKPEKPGKSQEPVETQKPEKPGKSQEPVEAQKPEKTDKSQEPVEAQKPEKIDKSEEPVETQKPEKRGKSQEPVETQKPEKCGKSQEPVEAQKPEKRGKSQEPVEAQKPEKHGKSQEPVEAQKPEKRGKSQEPVEAQKPEKTDKSQESVEAQKPDKSEESVKAQAQKPEKPDKSQKSEMSTELQEPGNLVVSEDQSASANECKDTKESDNDLLHNSSITSKSASTISAETKSMSSSEKTSAISDATDAVAEESSIKNDVEKKVSTRSSRRKSRRVNKTNIVVEIRDQKTRSQPAQSTRENCDESSDIKSVSESKEISECSSKSVLKSDDVSIREQFKVYNLRYGLCLETKFKHPLCDMYMRKLPEDPQTKVLPEISLDLTDDEPIVIAAKVSPSKKKKVQAKRKHPKAAANKKPEQAPPPPPPPPPPPVTPAKKVPASNSRKRPNRNRKKDIEEKDDFTIPEGFLEILGSSEKAASEKVSTAKKKRGGENKEASASHQSSENESAPIKRSRRIQEQHQKKMTELAVEMEREQRILEQMAKRSNANKNSNKSPQKTPIKAAIKIPNAKGGANAKGANVKVPAQKGKLKGKLEVPPALEEETLMDSKRTTRKMNNRAKNLTKMTLLYEDESKDSQFSTSRETEKSKRRKRGRGRKKGFKPWDVSSESSSSIEELTEEEEEEPDEPLIFDVNEDEFACEEVDPDAEPVVIRRARTAKKTEPVGGVVEPVVNDDTPCQKCGKYDKPEWILLCDKCDSGYHTHCLMPPLMIVPDGDWFCQPCEHMFLCQCLQEELVKLEGILKQKEREALRKQRLAYVGISLDNVLKPDKKEKSDESSKEEGKEEEEDHKPPPKPKETSDDERHRKLYGKRSVRARRNVNYQFKEYDELIASALQEELIEGKLPEEEFQEDVGSDQGSDKPFTAKIPKRKRRGRRYKDLDFSSDEDSGEEYQGSTDSEATVPPSSQSDRESPASGEWRVGKSRSNKPQRKTRTRRRRRRGGDSSEEDWEEEEVEEPYRPTTRRAAQKAISYRELSSDEEDEWGDSKPQRVAKRKKNSSSESETSFKRKTTKKKRIRKWASSDSSESEEEEKSMTSTEEESEEEGSDEESGKEWKIDKKEEVLRLKSKVTKKVLSSEEEEDEGESSTQDSAPKKQPKKIISDESEEEEEEEDDDDEDDDDEEDDDEEDESESEENSEESDEDEKSEKIKKKIIAPENKVVPTEKEADDMNNLGSENNAVPSEKMEINTEANVAESDKSKESVEVGKEFQPKVLVKKELCSVNIPLEPVKQTVAAVTVSDKVPSKTVRKEATKMVPCVIPYDKSPKSGQASNPDDESDKEELNEKRLNPVMPNHPPNIPKHPPPPHIPMSSSKIQFGGVLRSTAPINSSLAARPSHPSSNVAPRLPTPTNLSMRPSPASSNASVRHSGAPTNLSVRPSVSSSNIRASSPAPTTTTATAPSTQTVQTKSESKPYKSTIMEPFSNMDEDNDSDDEVPLERIPNACVPPPLPNRPVSYEREAEYRPAAKDLSTYSYAPPEEKSFSSSYSSLASFQDYSTRPSPLKPSLVETYPSNSSPSKLTPLDTYSQSSSPKGFISLDSYSENRKKKHFYGNPAQDAEPSHRPARPPSDNYQGGEIRFPPEPYPCPQSPNTYSHRSPPPAQRDPGTPPRLYSQFPDAYAPPRSPEYYQNHQYYASEERIPRPSYQPNYAPQQEPPPFVSNPYVATPVPQPNGGFMIDTLLRARNHENEEDELTGVTDIVSYITQE